MPPGRVGSGGSMRLAPMDGPREFLGEWLTRRAVEPGEVTVSSKWGYTYTADWKLDAEIQEVKDHSAAALARQWPETNAVTRPVAPPLPDPLRHPGVRGSR